LLDHRAWRSADGRSLFLNGRIRPILLAMEYVNNVHDRSWVDDDTPGARGYKYVEIVPDDSEYTSAFSCELMRLGPGDHSLTHVEHYNHLLFFLEGNGEITIGERTWPLSPGSYAKVEAGKEHSLRNHRDSEMLLLVVYDPPRVRDSGQ
jgi:mannose-6-phosphate isomerase-like protein (cupin superfamily)